MKAALVMPKANQYVVFAEPMTFSNGISEDTFQAVPSGNGASTSRSHKHGFLCRISKLKSRDFKVFDTPPATPINKVLKERRKALLLRTKTC